MSALSAPAATGIAHAVVLSAVPVPAELRRYLQGDDYIVACDAGYRNAQRLGVLDGVSETGVFYPLRDATLTPDYPLGVSNEFVAPQAVLSCRNGHGLVVLSRADG